MEIREANQPRVYHRWQSALFAVQTLVFPLSPLLHRFVHVLYLITCSLAQPTPPTVLPRLSYGWQSALFAVQTLVFPHTGPYMYYTS